MGNFTGINTVILIAVLSPLDPLVTTDYSASSTTRSLARKQLV